MRDDKLENNLSFVQEKEKKRQKIIKLLESKNVGRRLGSATTDDETPGTSSKSKPFKSGEVHVSYNIADVNLNNTLYR